MKKAVITSILYGFNQKKQLSLGVLLCQVQSFRTSTTYGLEILHQCGKRSKLKDRKLLDLIPKFVDATGERLVWNLQAKIIDERIITTLNS